MNLFLLTADAAGTSSGVEGAGTAGIFSMLTPLLSMAVLFVVFYS